MVQWCIKRSNLCQHISCKSQIGDKIVVFQLVNFIGYCLECITTIPALSKWWFHLWMLRVCVFRPNTQVVSLYPDACWNETKTKLFERWWIFDGKKLRHATVHMWGQHSQISFEIHVSNEGTTAGQMSSPTFNDPQTIDLNTGIMSRCRPTTQIVYIIFYEFGHRHYQYI